MKDKTLLNNFKNIFKWVGWLILYLLTSTILEMATSFPAGPTRNKFLIFFIIITGLILFIIISYYRKRIKNSKFIHSHKLNLRDLLQWIGLGGLMLAVQIGWGILVTYHLIKEPENQEIINQQTQALPFWNNFDSIIVAPIFEEIIFRGLFFNYFIPKFSKWGQIIGLIVSSLIFGYLHVLNFDVNTLMYSGLGLVLGITYLHFRDIRYDIGLHIANNFLSLL